MATSRGQKKAETRINTGLRPNQAFKVRVSQKIVTLVEEKT